MENNFKGTQKKVYALQFGSVMFIQDEDYYEANNVLDIEDVGEEIVKENTRLITDAFNIRQQINFDLPELLERYNELERWKKEASIVSSQIDFQELGKLLNVKLGSTVSEQLLPKVSELLNGYNKAVELLQKLTNDATFLEDAKEFLKTIE